ncbi:hypothetical protein ASD64_05810 [Mesorhizobium sp. Root157]|uniref:hypothetical protein n=1 Tax=Mesorhizobium sp. Root157 TaxID=1736477 RepID=UPI0006F38844|nr:hypothetical protein [Mesorhizobium sp. Root157]KQZ86975.1 hypothetical protein ASD64_05810 [Mesorhizobium sp. Root157]
MDRESRNAAIAALLIIGAFGSFAYYLPNVMLATGEVSSILAVVVVAIFMVALFVVFWLRGISQRRKGK